MRDPAFVSAGGAVLQEVGTSHEERGQILESGTSDRSSHDRTYSLWSFSGVDCLSN